MASGASHARILIVDDVPGNLVSMRAILEDGEYEVLTAKSGGDALEAVLQNDLACIILDVAMPGIDGFETASLIKDRERSRTIPILFVTASVLDIEHVFQGYEVGAVDYLQKPLNAHALRSKVKVFVDLHLQAREIERQARELAEAERRERALLEREAEEERARRETAQAALDLSEARFRALEETGLIGVVDFDLTGRITGANDAFWRLLGYRGPREISFQDVVPQETRAAEELELRELRSDGVQAVTEKELVRRDGGTVFVLIGRVLLERGEGRAGVAFVVDNTARKAVETERARILVQLRAAVRARDDFLSVAAHELRTPLTPLRLQIDALKRIVEKPAGIKALDRLDRSARRLARLVNELLDVARISAGRMRLELEQVDVAALAAETVERWRGARPDLDLRLTSPPALQGHWDRLRIEQILENLVSNAVKYGDEKPIEVRLQDGDGIIHLTVRDHGPGIPPEARDRIFERFERLPEHRAHGGFGLGLWIARQAATAHGGSIELGEPEGGGTEFVVNLPRNREVTAETQDTGSDEAVEP